jgi:hypothetical protein
LSSLSFSPSRRKTLFVPLADDASRATPETRASLFGLDDEIALGGQIDQEDKEKR